MAMASQVGDQQWWQEAEQSLQHQVCESLRDSQTRLGETGLRELPDERESIEELLKLLGPTDDPQMLGRIGSYEVLGVLGRGGMGAVFKAFDAPLNRFVAIKMLLPHLAVSGTARKRFAREAQAAAAVVDDHVMAIHCVDEWQGVPYLVMTYSRGVSLQRRLNDNGPLEVREILRIGMQAAKGLAAAHAQGIVHRDIKPANIFLSQSVERVQLMDFGLARTVDDASLTRSGTLAGTPQYMSPEQARAETVDHFSDLFSLGSVMYAMCTGHAPFRAESSYSVLRLITDKEPRSIREINPEIPEWLCSIISKLMSKQASDRFASAQEVAELLEDCLAHVQQPTTVPLPKSITSAQSKQHRRLLPGKFIAAVSSAFLMIFAGVFVLLEMNKGTLTIECEANDVPIRIMQGEKLVEKLTISTTGESVRVAAGNYKVEIDGAFDNIVVNGGQVALKRGHTEVVRIRHSSNEAQKDSSSPERIANLPEDTEVHVVGCYLATDNQPVNVRVQRTGKPMVVVLNAYSATSWNLEIDQDADVRGVILSGYFDQRFSHMAPKDQPTRILSYFPIWQGISDEEKKARASRCFYVWSPLLPDFGKMQSLIRDLTGEDVTTFQGIYTARSFLIDGQRGLEEAKVAVRWQNLSKRFDPESQRYRKVLAELESVRRSDDRVLNAAEIQKLNLLLETYEGDSDETPAVNPKATESSSLNKTLQQLQGQWQLLRQIDADGAESGTPAKAVWEFQGNRIVVRDSGPGGTMLIEVDDSHSPAHIKVALETESESGLGLLSVENDKLIICLGTRQQKPDPESRPEKLQWVSGVWYMELTRVQTGETPAIDHGNARSVVEAYIASALAGDVTQAAALAKNAPASSERIALFRKVLNLQQLKIQTVYVDHPAKPTRALATSVAVRLDGDHKEPDGRRDGFMAFTLEFTNDKWFVVDVDFPSETRAEAEVKEFLEANPDSIDVHP
ncbi:MAG: serine/threonine protein kinase [Planctomyces sp.]|nr:serine/threonine protein kinase [Planctomyces sp.]